MSPQQQKQQQPYNHDDGDDNNDNNDKATGIYKHKTKMMYKTSAMLLTRN